MNSIKSIFFLVIFGLLLAHTAHATSADREGDNLEFPRETIQPFIPEGEQDVKVAYLLDKDGSPYIISIESHDHTINRMINHMAHADLEGVDNYQDQTLSITFIYRNNR